jgi:hypothetical protein
MHRSLAYAALLLAPGFVVAQPNPADVKRGGWYTDYNQAKAEAKRTGKPMLVVFRCQP